MAALRMVVASARRAGHDDVWALTDETATLPVPALRVPTVETRLMLWTLEACAAYLASEAFDRDTVMLDVDQLVFRPLDGLWPPDADFGVLMRPAGKHVLGEPLLNGVQFWAVRAKVQLAALYRRVLMIARGLPETDLRWGADTIALRQALSPMSVGLHVRDGVVVSMVNSTAVLEAWSSDQSVALKLHGRFVPPTRPVLDFRWKRKPQMAAVYRAAFGDLP
jgi:hypothetical protein